MHIPYLGWDLAIVSKFVDISIWARVMAHSRGGGKWSDHLVEGDEDADMESESDSE
jgi:hypothetical protein